MGTLGLVGFQMLMLANEEGLAEFGRAGYLNARHKVLETLVNYCTCKD